MLDAPRHIDKVGDLAIQPVYGRIDDKIDSGPQDVSAQPVDHAGRGVAGILHPKDDLNGSGIILCAERHEIFNQPGLGSMQRLEERHPRDQARQAWASADGRSGRSAISATDDITAAENGNERCDV